jgi:hypothetical protein
MSETIRELIIQELIARAAVMRTTGSPALYATDIGATVLRERGKVPPGDQPCTVVCPASEESKNIHGKQLHQMPVQIYGLAKFGTEDPSVVKERILGDLIRCFTSPTWDRRRPIPGSSPAAFLPPLMESIVYQMGGTDGTLEDGSVSVGVPATFLVTYYTAIGDPCGQ